MLSKHTCVREVGNECSVMCCQLKNGINKTEELFRRVTVLGRDYRLLGFPCVYLGTREGFQLLKTAIF